MLIEAPSHMRQFPRSGTPAVEPTPVRRPRSRLASVVAFAGAAGLLLAYALPGGTYDIVVRQEYGIAIWWVLGLGFLLGLLPRARPAWPALLLIGALLAYAGWTAVSLGWSASSERTTAEIARVLEYLGLVVLLVSVLDRATWRSAAMGFGFAALLVCGLAVASRLAPGVFPANAFNGSDAATRLSYPFGYWNAVGAWASMATAIGLAWSAHDSVPARRAVALGLVPVAVLAAYLSYSRASIAGTAVAVIAVIVFSRNRLTAFLHTVAAGIAATVAIVVVRGAPEIAKGTGTRGLGGVIVLLALAVAMAAAAAVLTSVVRTDRVRVPATPARVASSVAIAALIVAGAAFGPRLASKAWHQFRRPAAIQSATDPASRLTQLSGSRYYYWRSAVQAFEQKPATGTGAGTYEFSSGQRGTDFVRNAHSLELENMAELGVTGLLLIVVLMAAAVGLVATARRRARRTLTAGAGTALLAAFLAYLLHASVDWMWQSTAVTVLALGGAAIASGRLSRGRPRIRWYGRAGVLLATAGAIVVQIPGLVSTLEVRHSQAAERAGNASLAYVWANAAVSAEPWAASPYEQRGLVLESGGRLAQAAADLTRAVTREPTNFMHWILLSRIETERGNLAAAIKDYKRARQLRPNALVFQYAPYFRGAPRSPTVG